MTTPEERKDAIANYRQENPAGTLAGHEVATLIAAVKAELEAMGTELLTAYPVLVAAEALYDRARDEMLRVLAEDKEDRIDLGDSLKDLLDATETFLKAGGASFRHG